MSQRRREVSITNGTAADIPRLEPLWLSVHRHHAESMPELAPYVADEVTWRERRALYENLFRKEDTLLFLASLERRLIGYALVHVTPTRDTWSPIPGRRAIELPSSNRWPFYPSTVVEVPDTRYSTDAIRRLKRWGLKTSWSVFFPALGCAPPLRAAGLQADVALPEPIQSGAPRGEFDLTTAVGRTRGSKLDGDRGREIPHVTADA